jgi:zinc/manganese transport system permease protein
MGFELHTTGAYLSSLAATFAGAAVFSLTRGNKQHCGAMQEASIGIVYVVSAALAIIVLDRLPGEAEHLKGMLVGNILFVTWPQVLKTLGLYAIIGLAHYVWRERFSILSFNPGGEAAEAMSVRTWDFLFYVLFGFVVTSSVELAGVLLVFTFLIIPAVAARKFAKSVKNRLRLGWALGVTASLCGIIVSARYDLPTGPAIICAFGVLSVSAHLAGKLYHERGVAPEPGRDIRRPARAGR